MSEENNNAQLTLAEITQMNNPHFLRYAFLLAASMSPYWLRMHPTFPSVRSTLDRFARILKGGESFDKRTFMEEWTTFFAKLVMEDNRLCYDIHDANWFFESLYSERSTLIFTTLLAVASTRQTYLSTEQASEATGIPASTLRRKAQYGDIPGVRRLGGGKILLFSVLALKSAGYEVNIPVLEVEMSEVENPD